MYKEGKVEKYDDVEGGVYKEGKVEKYDDVEGGRGV